MADYDYSRVPTKHVFCNAVRETVERGLVVKAKYRLDFAPWGPDDHGHLVFRTVGCSCLVCELGCMAIACLAAFHRYGNACRSSLWGV
jgi:hypothetical protein